MSGYSPESLVVWPEQATDKVWSGVADGAPLGTGVPAEDHRAVGRLPLALRKRVAYMVTDEDKSYATGFLVRVYYDGRTSEALGPGSCQPSAGAESASSRRDPYYQVCLLTAGHVLPRMSVCRQVKFCLDHEMGSGNHKWYHLHHKTLFRHWPGMDAAICAVGSNVPYSCDEDDVCIPILRPETMVPTKSPRIIIPQHPNATSMAVDEGVVMTIRRAHFTHDVNTLPGSSGAPVFVRDTTGNYDYILIGIHTNAEWETHYGERDEATPVRVNGGALIGKIADHLEHDGLHFKEVKVLWRNILHSTPRGYDDADDDDEQ